MAKYKVNVSDAEVELTDAEVTDMKRMGFTVTKVSGGGSSSQSTASSSEKKG